jgi:hypothetical protein
MTRNFGVLAPAFLAFAFVAYACTEGEVVQGPVNTMGSAGSTNPGSAGNTVGVGGTTGAAGTGNTVGTAGNTVSRGGTTGTAGNTVSRGGTTGTAGSSGGRGGTTGTGNTVGTAGSTGAGNTVGTAGVSGTAGTTGTAGSTGSCAPSFAVSADGYVQMPVSGGGCWTGYPFTYADMYGTMVMPTSFAACGAGCMLRMTGSIVAVSGTMYSYAGMGFNLGQTPAGGTTNTPVTPRGSGLTFNFSNTTTGGVTLRAQITNGTMTWCTNVTTSPASIPYSSFTVDCYNTPPGAAYAKQPITQIQMNLAGGTAAGTIGVTLMSVTENP